MLIYQKELLGDAGSKEFRLPYATVEEAKKSILKLDILGETPIMWYEHVKNVDYTGYYLIAIKTGYDYIEKLTREDYIGTLILRNGLLILHYFLVTAETLETW